MLNVKGLGIKNLAMTIALLQALSLSLKKDNKDFDDRPVTFYLDSNICQGYSSDGKIIYRRYDEETYEYKPISIFDEENRKSFQYGGDQETFVNNFEKLIKDERIWNEMQKYFPVSSFGSYDKAMFFYKRYFEFIFDSGCGYVAAVDRIFKEFEGREEEFEQVFGYPMYTVDDVGNIDFNYEILSLEFFNYSVIEKRGLKRYVYRALEKDLNEYDLTEYKKELLEEHSSLNEEYWNKWKELREKWENSENLDVCFGVILDNVFGYISPFLKEHNIKEKTKFYRNSKREYNVDDIVASENFTLCNEYFSGRGINPHYMYVTDVLEDGQVVVSSCGDKYFLDESESTWSSKLVLNLHK